MSTPNVRATILEVIKTSRFTMPGDILQETGQRLNADRNSVLQKTILAEWQNMFTGGLLAWGSDLLNSHYPHFHITERGKKTVENISRDPANPDGYIAYLKSLTSLDPIAESYIVEALNTYSANCFKATAVMVGAAAERMILGVRDAIVKRIQSLGNPPNRTLESWQVKTVLDEIERVLNAAFAASLRIRRDNETVKLKESFDYNWPTMSHMIRASRNDAGHPSSIDPVTPSDVHATLLTFPHHLQIAEQLIAWIGTAEI